VPGRTSSTGGGRRLYDECAVYLAGCSAQGVGAVRMSVKWIEDQARGLLRCFGAGVWRGGFYSALVVGAAVAGMLVGGGRSSAVVWGVGGGGAGCPVAWG